MIGYFVGGPLDGQVMELADGQSTYEYVCRGELTDTHVTYETHRYKRAERRIEGDDEAFYFRLPDGADAR